MENKYSIKDLARLLSVSENTIRKYEQDYNLHIQRDELDRRYYTEADIELFKTIKSMKDQGHNIYTIRRLLNDNPEAIEQKEQSLEIAKVNELSGIELSQIIQSSINNAVSCALQKINGDHRKEIESIRDEIRQELAAQQQQMEIENRKLLDYISEQRNQEKKIGLLERLFNKR